MAPFGRDALITSLQALPFEPEIARGVLRFFARHQGGADDAFTDQEPGKIFHEYRRGEMAACREIPFIPYYGTVDATPPTGTIGYVEIWFGPDRRVVREPVVLGPKRDDHLLSTLDFTVPDEGVGKLDYRFFVN